MAAGRLRGAVVSALLATVTGIGMVAAMPAQAQVVRSYDIPAGTLPAVLRRFIEASGAAVVYDAGLAQGVGSPGLKGSYGVAEALSRILTSTGLTYRQTGTGSFTLERAPVADAGTVQLGPVRVEGGASAGDRTLGEGRRTENPTGPGRGFLASRTLAGTKTDTPLIETPQSVSVVTRGQIATLNAQTVDQALRYTAGVEAESRANFIGFDFVYGRGFILDRYLDGLKLQGAAGYIAPSVDVYNLDRIEVLRGPASVLYGQASPGGLVNMVSKMPTAEPLAEVVLQGGSRNNFEGAFDLSGPLDGDGHLLYRLTALAHTTDTQVDFTRNRRVSVSPALTWQPDDATKLTLLLNYQRDPELGLYNFVPASGTILPNPNGKLPTSFYAGDPSYNRIDRTQYSVGYRLEHRLSDAWSVSQNFRYMHDDGNLDQILPLDMLDDRTIERYSLMAHDRLKSISLDNHAEARFATGGLRHTVLVGVDYQQTYFDELFGQDFSQNLDLYAPIYHLGLSAPAPVSDLHETSSQIGVYVQDQARLGRLALLLGGRHDWAHDRTIDRLAPSDVGRSDRRFTYRGGLVYLFDNGLAPYASYTTSFQPQAGVNAAGAAFRPTTGRQYEAGVKFQPQGSDSFVTVSAYHLRQQNVLTPDSADPVFSVQTGEVRTRGVEAEAHLTLAPGFNVLASYSYADPKVTRSNADNLGKVPLYVPRQLASAWSNYKVQDGPLRGLSFGAGVRFVGHTYGDQANTLRVPSYTLVDAMLGYDLAGLSPRLARWSLGVNASNLFDKTYVSECSSSVYCLYGLRRSVLVSLRYRR